MLPRRIPYSALMWHGSLAFQRPEALRCYCDQRHIVLVINGYRVRLMYLRILEVRNQGVCRDLMEAAAGLAAWAEGCITRVPGCIQWISNGCCRFQVSARFFAQGNR